jgi:hypothetical protein
MVIFSSILPSKLAAETITLLQLLLAGISTPATFLQKLCTLPPSLVYPKPFTKLKRADDNINLPVTPSDSTWHERGEEM